MRCGRRACGLRSGATLGLLACAAVAGFGCSAATNGSTGADDDAGAGDAGGVLLPFDDANVAPGSVISDQPTFGPTTVAARPPPPIPGGTLLVTADGTHAVASDPDRDLLYVVDLVKNALTATIPLDAGDEPGRLAQDGAGRVHVALRGGGALVTIDVAAGAITARRSVCPAPRGLAWDATADAVWVACATGELVSLPAAGGASTQTLVVERDLRDVVVNNGSLAVSEFRSAQLLHLDGSGNVTRRDQLPSPVSSFSPHVAWRTVAGPSGTFVAVHQAESTQSVQTRVPGGYGSGGCPATPISRPVGDAGSSSSMPSFADCEIAPVGSGGALPLDVPLPSPPPPPPGGLDACSGSIVDSVLTVLGSDGTTLVNTALSGVLPVDVSVSSDGSSIAVVSPGSAFLSGNSSNLTVLSMCGSSVTHPSLLSGAGLSLQLTAVAYEPNGNLLVQSREPAALYVVDPSSQGVTATIVLSAIGRDDTGHDVFHTQAGAGIACASCHPEGRDDGHVWLLDGSQRRTPSLRGTIAGTAPYHWPGDEPTLDVLVNDVYTQRMAGVALAPPVMAAMTGWVQSIPALPSPAWVDPAAAARGQALFERVDVGCSSCHSGPKLTDNATVDVGTGGAFQVPPLVGVGWRTPLMHDGCAATIADRFGACATPAHGSTSGLSTENVSDLIAYLESL